MKLDNAGDKTKTLAIFILAAFCCAAFAVIGFLTHYIWEDNKKAEITTASISQRIMSIGELAVTKVEYRDICRYEQGEIPYITRKSFNIIYNASAKIGIDISKANININESNITVALPKPKILDISIDNNSLEFYDEKFAVFNWSERSDTIEVLKKAEKAVEEKIGESGIIEDSAANAAQLIREFLYDFEDGRSVNIVFK